MSFFNELKRRNVFKVAIAYIIMAWLVMQVADVILNNIVAPGWVFHVLLLFLALGMPFAIFFAWAFELTPEGLKREHEVDRSQSITHQTSKKLNLAITGIMILTLGYLAYDKFVLSAGRETAAIESAVEEAAASKAAGTQATSAAETATKAKKSIAVLPFADMSINKDQEYLSDGLSEELLNLLAKIPELRVTSRTSAFSYKGKDVKIADVGKELNVAHVLEGSVRKAGNQVRITAQLIQVDGDTHLWSQTYDRTLDNIFAIQDEIATEVVAQLKLTLLGAPPTVQETDPRAYAVALLAKGAPDAALAAFEQELGDEEYRIKGTAMALHALGRQQEFEQKFTVLRERWGAQWPSEIAQVYAWLGDADAAFAWLDKSILQNEDGLASQFTNTLYQPIHNDPRWAAFRDKSGSSEQQLGVIKFTITLPE